jgi:flagellar protein FliS
MAQGYQNYRRVEVSTADPLRIVVLLYEGAIKNLNQALRLLETDPETASARLTRTLDIINYLRSALDHEQGGEISANLERLYEYMRDRLSEANIHHDTGKIQEVIGLLQVLLEGWHGISGTQTAQDEPARPIATAAPTQRNAPSANFSLMG